MPLVVDPIGAEIRALQKDVQWKGKQVLEIGCGDGRLTLRLAALGPAHVEAIDPDASRVRAARKGQPPRYRQRIAYHVGRSGKLRYRRDAFDIAIFAWSL